MHISLNAINLYCVNVYVHGCVCAFVCVFVSVARSGNFASSGMECDGVMDLPL